MTPKSTIDKEYILHFIRNETTRPLSIKDISRALDIHRTELRTLKRILRSLAASGDIFKTKSGSYGPAEKMNLVTGNFEAHRDGYGFVIPDKSGVKDIFIPPRRTMGAMSGDHVVARIERPAKMEGSIIKILERGKRKVLGRLCHEKNIFYVQPKGKNVPYYILIPPKERGGAKAGDTVKLSWVDNKGESDSAEAKVK